jgi:uncharacterized protein
LSGRRTLVLAGGLYHPWEDAAPPLADALADAGLEAHVCPDVGAGLARLAAGEFELLVVDCLRWSMTQNEKYAPHREALAFAPSPAEQQALRDYVARGRGLLGVHAAPISFDTMADWPDLLGVGWAWGRSYHPPCAPAQARVLHGTPVTAGGAGFEATDEIYSQMTVAPWMQPFMEACHPGVTEWRPVGFWGEDGGTRRVYCGLGHDGASRRDPVHRRILADAARWAFGAGQGAGETRHA